MRPYSVEQVRTCLKQAVRSLVERHPEIEAVWLYGSLARGDAVPSWVRQTGLLIAAAVAIFLLTQTFYTVDPTKQVLVRQFGAIVGEPKTSPGLYAKVPLIQDIQRIDRRLLDYEAEEFEIIAGDQKRLVVDAYARYRVVAAKTFAQTVPGGESALRGLLDSLINSEIRGVLSSVPLHAVLTDRRESLMEEITRRVNAKTKELGVETVDVRIKRADLPQANSQSVYNRMKTDREREAGQLRAEGDEEKARITATADPMPGRLPRMPWL